MEGMEGIERIKRFLGIVAACGSFLAALKVVIAFADNRVLYIELARSGLLLASITGITLGS